MEQNLLETMQLHTRFLFVVDFNILLSSNLANILVYITHFYAKRYKLDRLAMLTYPPPANSTTMHSRLICQDIATSIGGGQLSMYIILKLTYILHFKL